MKIYRVGGSVRDVIRGVPHKDNDFVVVGATVEEFMLAYPEAKQIGKFFPVFKVGADEYAFARKERKTGPGHTGFEVVADPSVSLLDDLERRDLTCNAMAVRVDGGEVVDPFHGRRDIQDGILRHVGSAFAEDPLRIFRLARFAAQFGWGVADETLDVAASIPDEEVAHLSGERVGEEFRRAMRAPFPWRFFETLENAGKLHVWLPELQDLRNVPAGPPECHAEGSALTHTLLVLRLLASDDEAVRVAALFHDLGKGVTPEAEWPHHYKHEELGVPLVAAACARLRLPNDITAAAMMACRQHMRVHKFLDMRKGKMVDLVAAADRTIIKAEGLAAVVIADSIGRLPRATHAGPDAMKIAAGAVRAENGHPIPPSLEGPNIGLHIRARKGNAALRAIRGGGDAEPVC